MASPQPRANASNPQVNGSDPSATARQGHLTGNGNLETGKNQTEKKISYLSLPNKGQLAVLCIARMADPLATSSIQAYMFYQLRFFDPSAPAGTISTQAGIIVSARTAAQVITGMFWGRLADSDWGGRKLVLTVGLLSNCISCLGYGFSRTFTHAVFWQVFGGAMSSNVAITRCVVAEINPEKRYRVRALTLLPLFANAGMLIGPLVGGLLSSNEEDGAQAKYPYAAPNIVTAVVYIVAALGVVFGLEETLESLQHGEHHPLRGAWRNFVSKTFKRGKKSHDYVAISTEEPFSPTSPVVELSPTSPTSNSSPLLPKTPKRKRKLPFRRIWTFNVICTLLSHFIIAGHLGTFSNLWAIYLSTPVARPENQHPPIRFSGGLGMLPRDVGFAMSLLGLIGVVLQIVIYPMLNDRFGTIRIWRTALFVFPITYVVAPFPSLVASFSGKTALVWLSMGVPLVLFITGRTGVTPATTLLINDCTPHPSVRGTIHTAGTVIGNLSRSVFPLAAFAIFGAGLGIGVIGLGFWCLACLAILACIASQWVREGSNGKDIVLDDDEEEEEENRETQTQRR
ncbi:MFS general substrate transporter [Glonium stellatum]|uniref:MFS general substrate transporter n=1 Tax=Glonium stellatum TaxID=574774 RepID=A0A8E2JXS8_9PEZI|nr:MFS general substrate transporter [Glonium stellatum]